MSNEKVLQHTSENLSDSIDQIEINKFTAIANEWWNPEGKFRPLHRLNPPRLAFIRNEACKHFNRIVNTNRPLNGLSVLDIGCGGGLVAEPLTRLGATVTGIDASAKAISVAQCHAIEMGLDIDYRQTSLSSIHEEGSFFDIVLNLEVVEHVTDATDFLRSSAALVGPNGMLVTATLNRTLISFTFAIIGAEYILGWLPRGTHDWNRFIRPSELAFMLRGTGLMLEKLAGVTYSPITDRWRISDDNLSVNYLALALRTS